MEIRDEDLKLVHWTLNRFFKEYANDEDLFQEACMALVKAQDKYTGTVADNQGFLVNQMKWAIYRYWKNERRSNPQQLRPFSLDSVLVESEEGGGGRSIHNAYNRLPAPEYHPWAIDLPNCLDEKEKTMVTMLAEGYNQNEVADYMGVSRQRISQWKQKVGKKLLNTGYISEEDVNDRKLYTGKTYGTVKKRKRVRRQRTR